MEKRIKELFNERIFAEAKTRYGIHLNNIRLLDGFESFIYEYKKGNKEYILRISHSSRRTSSMIAGEIDWLNYLADHGVCAARAVPSEHDNLVEVLGEDHEYFSVVSFEKAVGNPPQEHDWDEALSLKIGRLLGKMHALTKHYTPGHSSYKRPEWYEETEDWAERFLPPSETTVIRKFQELHDYLHTLPQEKESYGLIHTDVHRGNFFVEDGNITLFDFDDCQYSWFVYDIAIALFYIIPHHCSGKKNLDFAKNVFKRLMEGYSQENTLDGFWLQQIPYFLKLREMDLYVVIHRSCDLNDLDPWCQSFMTNRKYNIEHNVPYLDINFDEENPFS